MIINQENFQEIYTILGEYFAERCKVDISDMSETVKNIVLKHMHNVSNSGTPSKQHKKTVLLSCQNEIIQLMRNVPQQQLQPSFKSSFEQPMQVKEISMEDQQKNYEALVQQRKQEEAVLFAEPPPTVKSNTISRCFVVNSINRDFKNSKNAFNFISGVVTRDVCIKQPIHRNNTHVPGTATPYTEGYVNTHGFDARCQHFEKHNPQEENGPVIAYASTPPIVTIERSNLSVGAKVYKIIIGVHNYEVYPHYLKMANTIYALGAKIGNNVVYTPENEPFELNITNGCVNIDMENEENDIVHCAIENDSLTDKIKILITNGTNIVVKNDYVRLMGACIYCLPGESEDEVNIVNDFLRKDHLVLDSNKSEISVMGNNMVTKVLSKFPHTVKGLLIRPLRQASFFIRTN